jgi:dipeptidyl aminopeptidase/acylaminoacyl peptidase
MSLRRSGPANINPRSLCLCLAAFEILLCCNRIPATAQLGHAANFQKPCIDNSILADLVSHYPVPVSVSPDGRWVLLRTANLSGDSFGLAIMERASGRTAYSVTWPQPILRLEWRPDSSEVSFFAMRGFEAGRDLFVWNFGQNRVRQVNTPETRAEPQVRWAPNGHWLAFSDARWGLVAVDPAGVRAPFVKAGEIGAFDWLADSATIAFVESDKLDRVGFFDIATGVTKSRIFSRTTKIFDIAAAPTGNKLLLVESTATDDWRIEAFDPDTQQSSTPVRSPLRVGSPIWMPSGQGFCFELYDKVSTKLFAIREGSTNWNRLSDLGGTNNIRGVLPGGRSVIVTHSGVAPVALFALSLTRKKPKCIYSSHSRTLPAVKAQQASARAEDGREVPVLIWRAQGNTPQPAAIIRVRGGPDTIQFPVWEEHIQLFAKRGIHFVAVNRRGEATSARERRADVIAAIEYAHQTLRVPYHRIVLLGHSSGAGLAAAVCLTRPGSCGVLALVSFGNIENDLLSEQPNRQSPRLILFYPLFDPTPRFTVLRNLSTAFGEGILSGPHTSLFQFADEHNLMYSRSWAAVYSVILGELQKGVCAVDGNQRNLEKHDPLQF